MPKRRKVSTAQPSPSRSSAAGTPSIASMSLAPAAWSAKSISVRSRSGASAGEALIGAERSTNRGDGGYGTFSATYFVSRYSWMPSGPPSRPKPDCLDAAERRAGVGDHALVEADHAGLEALDDLEGAVDVLRVDVGDEAVLGRVGRGDRLVVGVEGPHRRDGAEDLLVEQARVVGDVGEHRRLVEVAGAVDARAADEHLGAALARVVDELGDLAALVVVDQRADLDVGLGAAADLHVADLRRELLGELVGDRAGDVEAVGRRARLAAVAHLGDQRALDRGVDVGVVEDQERRVAAELHRHAQDLVGRLLDQRAPDLGRAR